jgi:ABC-type multidrug transport system fused ATPase/permease subunit
MQVQMEWNKFLSVSGSLENIQEFSQELASHQETAKPLKFERLQTAISIESAYLKLGDTSILQDVSLEVRRNETIALVGESGSGKTSFINMLCGLLPPTKGSVKVDGVDLQDLDIMSYQQRIGYITQEPIIFNDTIFNNVTFFAEPNETNRARFREALQRAHLTAFVESCTEREQSLLGNNGINLSGGQKQRIAIARELFKDVDILLMDEATSALDTATEREIKANIDELRGLYTIIIVAHRLSTIRDVDRVVVFNQGRIESIATYEDLLVESPSFKRMVQLQEV